MEIVRLKNEPVGKINMANHGKHVEDVWGRKLGDF